MKYFSMFTGIGGFELGIKQAQPNWKCIGYSEIDKFCCELLKNKFPEVNNYGSAKEINPEQLPDFDLLCGGFPCQAFSIAGKRKGFREARGTLFFDILKIAKCKKPQVLFLENVKGLLSHDNGWSFAEILRSLDELGYSCEWQVLNSKFFGVPQNRERVFIIGHLRGKGRQKIFPIRENATKIKKEHDGKKPNVIGYTNPNEPHQSGIVLDKKGICLTLYSGMHKSPYKILVNKIKKLGGLYGGHQAGGVYDKNGLSPTLDNMSGGNRQPIIHSLFPRSSKTNKGGTGHLSKQDGISYCLDSGNCQAIEQEELRRLTPKECERLQGFPDNWTEGFSDTQRYKMCGNAVTVNVIQAIAERLNK